MRQFLIILNIAALFCADVISAQPQPTWFRYFPASGGFYDIFACDNGDLAVCGSRRGGIGWFIGRVDRDGEEIWAVSYEGQGRANSLIEADNGDFIVGGRHGDQYSILRLSEEGEEIWWRDYGAGSCNGVIELKSGEIASAGWVLNPRLAWLIIVNENGGPIVNRTYAGHSGPHCYGLREAEDGLVICGSDQEMGRPLGWLRKVNYDGEPIWLQEYQNRPSASSYNLLVRSGATGFAFLSFGDRDYPGLLKTDARGNLEWWTPNRDFHVTGVPGLLFIPETGYMIVGGNVANLRALGLFHNLEGELRWQANYADPDNGEYHPISMRGVVIGAEEYIYAGGAGGENDGEGIVGMVACLGQMPSHPTLRWSPFDTLQAVLAGDSICFSVYAEDVFARDIEYDWLVEDTLTADHDTTHTVLFDSLGVIDVETRVHAENSTSSITWHITVTDLFISSFSPDTLNLAIRRGSSLDFSLDTVRYTEGEEPEYLWTKSNRGNQEQEDAGTEPRATISFLQSGSYAVEGLAHRGESHDAVTWDVAVRGAIWSFAPEDVTLEVLPDSTVRFEVVPSEPEAEGLSVQWLVDGEVVGEDTTSFEWSFSGADLNPPYQVAVVVADTVEADTVVWEVTVMDLGVWDDEEVGQAGTHVLLSVSPNPFNSLLTIRYSAGTPPPAPPPPPCPPRKRGGSRGGAPCHLRRFRARGGEAGGRASRQPSGVDG